MPIKKVLWYFVHVILPVLCGGLVYIAYRSTDLKMFSWFNSAGLDSIIVSFRTVLTPAYFPDWFIYSLPDSLWTYALTCGMIALWSNRITAKSAAWIFVGPFIAITAEIGQTLGLINGTFDKIDLAFILEIGRASCRERV